MVASIANPPGIPTAKEIALTLVVSKLIHLSAILSIIREEIPA